MEVKGYTHGYKVITYDCDFELELIDVIMDNLSRSCVTDVVECNPDSIASFSKFWSKNDSINVPSDLITMCTIPICDIEFHEKLINDITNELYFIKKRIIIFDYCFEDNFKKYESDVPRLVGVMTIGGSVGSKTIEQKIVPIVIHNDVLKLVTYEIWIEKENKCIFIYDNITKEFGSVIEIAIIGLRAWYGVQLALLHPVTKQIFSNPVKEKRDRKEIKNLYKVPENRRQKYIKKHYITSPDIVKETVLKAVNESRDISDNQKKELMSGKRKFGELSVTGENTRMERKFLLSLIGKVL